MLPEWLAPWLFAAVCVWPLYRIEGWIQLHIQGLGLLITDENHDAAVLIYYIIMFPGVMLHELSQYLLARLLGVKIKKFQFWPPVQSKGSMRLRLVDIDQRRTDIYRATLIGMIPLIIGVIAIALIGAWRFDVQSLLLALGTGDWPTITAGVREFMSVPDFFMWIYLVFSIANAMLPEGHDQINWWLPIGIIVALMAFLLVLDLGILAMAFIEGPLAIIGRALSFSLGMALVIDLFMMALIWFGEFLFSRLLDRELEYK